MFNRYTGGGHFGTHVDTAIRALASTGQRIRTDISATLFLSSPQDYDGGELFLKIPTASKASSSPPATWCCIQPSALHRVEAVTRGARVASFFWIESADHAAMRIVASSHDLDTAIPSGFATELPDSILPVFSSPASTTTCSAAGLKCDLVALRTHCCTRRHRLYRTSLRETSLLPHASVAVRIRRAICIRARVIHRSRWRPHCNGG